jgi:hypothetical protein
MAKQPETHDHFRIHADNIGLEGLGVVLTALARLGITNVTYELVTDILAYKVPVRVFETDALDLARTFIKQHHTFKARELTLVFEQSGRSAANGFSVMKKLVELNELRKLGGGHYQSTEVKALAAPEDSAKPAQPAEPAKPHARAGIPPKRYPVSNIVLLWNAIERRKQITRAEMAQILVDNERPKKSIDGVVGKLKEAGRLKSLSDGVYEILKPAKASRHG